MTRSLYLQRSIWLSVSDSILSSSTIEARSNLGFKLMASILHSGSKSNPIFIEVNWASAYTTIGSCINWVVAMSHSNLSVYPPQKCMLNSKPPVIWVGCYVAQLYNYNHLWFECVVHYSSISNDLAIVLNYCMEVTSSTTALPVILIMNAP